MKVKSNAPVGRPPKDLDQLADELLYWSTQPDSFNLIGFSRPRCVSVTKLPEWAKKSEKFREALTLAKESIAMNRFEAACANEMPKEFFTRVETQYDPLTEEYRNSQKLFDSKIRMDEKLFEHNLKLAENQASGTQAAEIISKAIQLTSNIKP